MIIIAFSTFALGATQATVGTRLAILVTLFLALVAFHSNVSGDVPRVSTITGMDQFIWMSYAFVVLTILVTSAVAALLYFHHGNGDVATMVDLYGAAALGCLYLVMLSSMIASSCGKSHGVRCCDGQRHMRRSPLRRT